MKLFDEKGYVRRTCPQCNRAYWTLDPNSATCGDQPCTPYGFLDNPPTNRRYTTTEIREMFLSFFEEHQHARIRKYPVLARWRDDVFFVGASVYNFQPWVTEGIIPPPANPLTISQPCIRLTDIDLIGKTGRHLTSFEMMAHHAFNTRDHRVYWTDETAAYCFEFFTERLGVKPEKINFVEDMWVGGGNAGEDLEVVIDGIEVSTLVFMHYKMLNGNLKPIDNLTVDTGYGLERIAWLSNGAPTIYNAIFQPVVTQLVKAANLTPPSPRVLVEVSKAAGQLKSEGSHDLCVARAETAAQLGLQPEELDKKLRPLELVFAIADFTRTLIFMLGEGTVPSNVDAGYLARLLARRTLRALDELGNDLTLIDVLTVQLDAMAMDFPEYAEKGEGIFKIAELEESRYRQVLTRGKEILTRYTATAKARNETRLSSETLMELYDSHGLPPDFVKQTLQPMNVQVDFPEDFFAQIAKRHEKPAPAVHEETRTDALKARLSHLPPTRKLFYEDQYMREFDATVLDVDSRLLILDQTAFYAEGGGQLADTGVVRHEKGECRVVNVQSVNNVIVHFIEGQPPEKGWRVRGVLDWTRRRALMRHHTATHVLMGAAVKVLGDHVWQAGAQKDVDKARLDITHYDKLTTEQLQQIETLANDAVMAELPVEIQLFPRSEAEAKFGFRLYQGGVIPDRELRVIHIGGWDVEACAGTHCKSTGEIGFIKIIRGERIQDGVERLHFAAGLPAVEYSQSETERLKILSEILETPRETLEKSAETLKQDLKTLRKKLESLEHTLADYYTSQLIDSAVTVGPVKVVKSVMEGEEAAFLITLGGKMIESDPRLVVALVTRTEKAANVVVMAGNEAVRHGVHAGKIVSEIAKAMNGKGGGKPYLGQGGSSNTAKAEDALKTIEEHIRSMVKAKRHDR